MAPPIDQLLKSATTLKAERLILEAGKNAFVCTNTGIKELTRTQLAHYDIFMLISPIMPGDNEMALARQPSTEFDYLIEGVGEFNVTVTKDSNGLKVIFKPVGAPAEPSSAPAEPSSALATTPPVARPQPPTQPMPTQSAPSAPSALPVARVLSAGP